MTISSFAIVAVVLLLWATAWKLRHVRGRQGLLLVASYIFYASWGIGFLAVLIASSLANFALASILRRRLRVTYLWIGVALNILLLGAFKYLPSLLELAGEGSWEARFSRHILMPIGISFWTFQALSHLIDVYLEDDPEPTLLEFCLYMAFWPTVLSGPICRLQAMLPQFRRQPVLSAADFSAGALYLVQGVLMKMYLAQLLTSGWSVNAGVAAGYDQIRGWGAIDVWLLGIGYGFLLFFDFAGYSLMAIGVARLFGIRLAENFDRPFLASTPASFWNRWHMSLSFWIRDYVFTPLSFARRERWWSYVALIASMTLFGLWHGAKWTFVVFGLYHGALLVFHRIAQRAKSRISLRLPTPIRILFSWSTTFLLVSIGFVLFRANDLPQAMTMIQSILSPGSYLRFAMPPSFYLLIPTVAVGYFGAALGHSTVRWCMARYEEVLTQQSVSPNFGTMTGRAALMMGSIAYFLTGRLWWWLGPVVASLTVLVAVAIYTQSAVISVRPFIYTLF